MYSRVSVYDELRNELEFTLFFNYELIFAMFVIISVFLPIFAFSLLATVAIAEDEDSNDDGDAKDVTNVVSDANRIGEP